MKYKGESITEREREFIAIGFVLGANALAIIEWIILLYKVFAVI
jgi:hypothetical protein